MAGQIGAQEGALLKGADTVAEARAELTGKIKTVESQMLSIGSSWQGVASVAFQKLMSSWNEDAAKVTGALDGLEESLRVTQSDIDATEEEHMSAFNRIAARLG